MKLLIVCQVTDLKYGLGTTPAWWQLFKALHQLGNELIIVPYLGDPIQSPWWCSYSNPCAKESVLYNRLFEKKIFKTNNKRGLFSKISNLIIGKYINPKWRRCLLSLLDKEAGIDAILFISTPLNHFTGIPSAIKAQSKLPVIYYDGDMPTILPGYAEERGFRFSYYINADLSEYDAFITNSKGVIPILEEMGAQNVDTLYYGIDPDLYSPICNVEQDIDFFYYGHGSRTRERRLNFMITQPSIELPEANFIVAGRAFEIDMGLAKIWGDIPLSVWRTYCCRSKVNLNITREIHAEIYASSTSRIFELASLGCTIVSDPYAGLDEWFEVGKEVFVASNAEEAIETYRWLLSSPEIRAKAGQKARERVMQEHTYIHRAGQLISLIASLPGRKA